MLTRFCDRVARIAEVATGALFFGLIVTVAAQVLTRNVLRLPMLWTGDVAQLLFAWLVFVGAALGLRRGAHYAIDLLPRQGAGLRAAVDWLGIGAGGVVVYILVRHGWTLAALRAPGEIQSLGISRLWLYAPIPLCGAMMALFLLEAAVARFGSGQR